MSAFLEVARPVIGLILRSPILSWMLIGLGLALLRLPANSRRQAFRWGWVAVVLGAGLFLLEAVLQLAGRPGLDHIAVQGVNVAALIHRGQPLYHALDAPFRYSLVYGPVGFLLNAAILTACDGSLAAVRAVYVLSTLLAIVLTCRVLRRIAGPSFMRAGALTFAIVVLGSGTIGLAVRGDALLTLVAALAIGLAHAAAGDASRWARAAGVGALFALATGTKLHGGLYVAPAIALLVLRSGLAPGVLAIMIGAVLTAAPFAHPAIDAGAFWQWIAAARSHGISAYLLTSNLGVALFLLGPLWMSAPTLRDEPAPSRGGSRIVLGVLTLAMILVCVVAAKPAAGPYHLLPFVPMVLVAYAWRARWPWQAVPPAGESSWHLAWPLAGLLFVALAQVPVVPELLDSTPQRAAVDLERLVEELGDATVQIGPGSSTSRAVLLSRLSPRLVWRGQPYWFDLASLSDLSEAGIALPEESRAQIRSCRTQYWLIPRGEQPFDVRSMYPPHARLFDEAFRHGFSQSHARTGQSDFFDVWRCRPPARDVDDRLASIPSAR